jgi:hypothetical protein
MFRSGAGSGSDGEGETLSKSPFRYLLYVIMLLVPFTFGLEYVVAGDIGGAGFKFLTSIFFFILAPVGIIYTLMNFIHAVVIPKSLFEQGTYHLFPASLFIGPRGVAAAGVLGPKDVPEPTEACSVGIGAIFGPFTELLKMAVQNITAPATAAVGAVAGAVQASATAVKTGAEVVVKTGETISAGLDAAKGLASGAGGLVSGVKGAVEGQIQEKLQEAAQGAVQGVGTKASTIGSVSMVGGSGVGAYEAGAGDWALILLMMGTGAYFLHKKYKEYFVDTPKKTERAEYNGVPIPATSK